MFANDRNYQEPIYCTRKNSAWRYNWGELRKSDDVFLWANPPFSQLSKVVTKLCLEPTKMILVTPDWHDQHWSRILDKISVARVEIPSGTPLYTSDWENKPLPAPIWNTFVSLVDTTLQNVSLQELDPKLVRQI